MHTCALLAEGKSQKCDTARVFHSLSTIVLTFAPYLNRNTDVESKHTHIKEERRPDEAGGGDGGADAQATDDEGLQATS